MTFEEDVERMNLKHIIIGSIVTALGFLVALSWRDTVQELINMLVPKGEGLIYKFVAALIVTVVAVLLAYIIINLGKSQTRSRRLVRSAKKEK